MKMLKYELDVAGAGLAEERRYRVWRGCVLEEEKNDTGHGGVVILKTGIIVEGLMVVVMWVKEGVGGWEPVVG